MSPIPILTTTPSDLSSASTSAAFALFQSSAAARGRTTLTRTLSEGELSTYSSVSSMRDTIISARLTRESIRKSRASLRVLREEARQTLLEANDLRRQMQLLLRQPPRDTTTSYDSDQESDSGVLSHPTVDSDISDLTC